MRIGLKVVGATAAVLLAGYIANKASPWPSALVIRYVFEADARRVNQELAGRVPAGVAALRNEAYDPADPAGRLDVFFPAQAHDGGASLLTVVWIHGGGWISGSKDDIANYARIIAAAGYTVVTVDYAVAPERTYPTPVRQVNSALGYLAINAARLHVDPNRLVLAGDSAGAQIAAQVANLTTSPAYADALQIVPAVQGSHVVGVLLYCGPYDMQPFNASAARVWFSHTLLWSYSGTRHFAGAPELATLSVIRYVTPLFPPSFISAGNADPLAGQSQALAAALHRLGVPVQTVFFPEDYSPGQPHEYQFNLGTDEGQRALERSLQFLASLVPATR